jgi:hypothetical protein
VAVLMVAQVLQVVTAVMYLLEQAEMALVRQEETVVTEAKPYSTVVVTQKAPIVSKQRTKTNQVTKRRDKDRNFTDLSLFFFFLITMRLLNCNNKI